MMENRTQMGSTVSLDQVSITLGGQPIVRDISLNIAAGEFICLLGPSGCGKSTVMNAIAGFLPAAGSLRIGDQPVKGPGVDRGVVFQSSEALFPWLTVRENVGYGLRLRAVPPDEIAASVDHYLALVGLSHAADKFPQALSGGMRQRAQIARVLINQPSVVLMDEPFGALDAQTRESLQGELDRIWRETGCTILFVTHDIWEAILLADRIVVMTEGPAAAIRMSERVPLARPRDPAAPETLALYARLRSQLGGHHAEGVGASPDSAGRLR